MTFAVLFVCTGNICRSPIAERLFTARVDPGAPVIAVSAGTSGLVGHGMDAPSALALRELGGDPDGHIAQRSSPELVLRSDLILTAQIAHRSMIVTENPSSYRRCFTMREFGRLGVGLDPLPPLITVHRLKARVAEVAARRGMSESAVDPRQDDIGDPFGARMDVALQRAGEVSDAVDAVIDVLGLSPEFRPR